MRLDGVQVRDRQWPVYSGKQSDRRTYIGLDRVEESSEDGGNG
jgi:hypothetical protein